MSKFLSLFLPSLRMIGILTLVHLTVFGGVFIGVSIYDSNQNNPAGTNNPDEPNNPDSTEPIPEPMMVNDTYNLLVEMDQWNMTIYDLNQRDSFIEEGMSETEAKFNARYRGQIGPFELGKMANLTLVSLDVQHGFAIDEVDLAIALNRPSPDQERGSPTVVDFQLPEEDLVMTAYCHIFCGLGHDWDSHKIDFIVGHPVPTTDFTVSILNLYLVVVGIIVVGLLGRMRRKLDYLMGEDL